jgi:hypothetical protein
LLADIVEQYGFIRRAFTNMSESMNQWAKITFQSSDDLFELVVKSILLFKHQEKQIFKSLCGFGPFRLTDEYKHLAYDETMLMQSSISK